MSLCPELTVDNKIFYLSFKYETKFKHGNNHKKTTFLEWKQCKHENRLWEGKKDKRFVRNV